ncbi:MAG TPA: hypothetical protein VFX15_03225 [Actinomycetes bacterium]|nr:hypothetical protein [Actinomycetes bacterium]
MPETHVIEVTTYALPELEEEGASGGYERALDTLREHVLMDDYVVESTLDNDAVELFKAVGITVPQKTEVVHVKENGKFTWDEHHKPITKMVTRDDTIWESYDVDRGEFTLNRRAVVDERAFLRALQWYLAGKDIRDLPELQWGQPTPPRPLAASPREQRVFDLRSRDARIIREQGLVIHSVNSLWGGRLPSEFDLDYHYDGLSEQTKDDCNSLLSDLCHEVIALMRDEIEYATSEEALLEMAEANEYRFTENGSLWRD